MPTVLRREGFRFAINTDDHEPPHAHVFYGGGVVIINISAPGQKAEVRKNHGVSSAAERKVVRITNEHQIYLLAKWEEVHGRK